LPDDSKLSIPFEVQLSGKGKALRVFRSTQVALIKGET
jgi:hypothetical protein